MKKLSVLLLLLGYIISSFIFNNKTPVFASTNSAEIVMEVESKKVLHENNAEEKKFMASTTKILTAITIIETSNIDDEYIIPKDAIGIEGSSIYLEQGEKLKVIDLLYGLMLRSGNDSAVALALYKSGSINEFAKLMNQKAQEIGAKNSNFTNPHGLHDENHYTTAYDLALISAHAIKNPVFKKIVSTKSKEIPWSTRDYNRILINKNKMLTEFDGSTGIKTGFTKKAGRCLVSSCNRNGMELICVVLNCPPMFERSKELLASSFENYSLKTLVNSEFIIDFIKIVGENDKKCAICIKKDIVLPLNQDEEQKINIVYNYPDEIEKPIEKDEEIGQIEIYVGNKLIFLEKIYTIIEVK